MAKSHFVAVSGSVITPDVQMTLERYRLSQEETLSDLVRNVCEQVLELENIFATMPVLNKEEVEEQPEDLEEESDDK